MERNKKLKVAVTGELMVEEIQRTLPKSQSEALKLLYEEYSPLEIDKMKNVARAEIAKTMKKLRSRILMYLEG